MSNLLRCKGCDLEYKSPLELYAYIHEAECMYLCRKCVIHEQAYLEYNESIRIDIKNGKSKKIIRVPN
jgi:hypothetical protein